MRAEAAATAERDRAVIEQRRLEAAILTERERLEAERERAAAAAEEQRIRAAAEAEKERIAATAAAEKERFEAVINCYDCVFICLNDCLAYLLCIVYFRDIN